MLTRPQAGHECCQLALNKMYASQTGMSIADSQLSQVRALQHGEAGKCVVYH